MANAIKKIMGIPRSAHQIADDPLMSDAALEAYYKVESGALTTDSSGNGETLTNNNTVGETTGKFGGGSDAGTTNTNKSLSRASNYGLTVNADRTMTGWFKMNTELSGADSYGGFLTFGYPTEKVLYGFYYMRLGGVNTLVIPRVRNGIGEEDAPALAINLGTTDWYFLAMTLSGTTLTGYKNGVQIGQATINTGNGSSVTQNGLAIHTNGGQYLSCSADDIAIFSKALTPTEIYRLYNGNIKKLMGKGITGGNEIASMPLAGDANLRAYYKLDNVNDSSGNGYNLTNTGTTPFNAAKFGNGADFGTANSSKKLEIASKLGLTTNYTFSFWLKMNTEIPSGVQDFFFAIFNSTAILPYIEYAYNSGTRRLQFSRLKIGILDQNFQYNITLGTTWHHIVMTYDGTNVIGYIDGAYINSVAASGNGTGSYPDTFGIGQQNTNYASAIIDDFGVWSRVLTATEISNIYNTQIKKFMGVANV